MESAKIKEQYYTPKLLAEFMVRSAINQYDGDIKTAKFLEPACGEGALIEAIIMEVQKITNENIISIQKRIHAYDIDDDNIAICKEKFPYINLTRCDFVLYSLFGEHFDICVANPPWGALVNTAKDFIRKKRSAVKQKAFEKIVSEQVKQAVIDDKFKKKGYPYRSCYEENFVRKCLPICKAYCFLVSHSSVLTIQDTKDLREHLFQKGKLTEVVVFENRKKIFTIGQNITFAAISGGGEEAKESNFIQGVTELSELAEVEALFKGKNTPHFQKVTMDLEFIKGFSPEVGAIPYIKNQREVNFVKELLKPREGLKLLQSIVETKSGIHGTRAPKTGDSVYKELIEEKGFTLPQTMHYFEHAELIPMYKGAFFNHFDPLFLGAGKEQNFNNLTEKLTTWEQRIEQFAVKSKLVEGSSTNSLIGNIKITWRRISQASNQRTLVPALIPDEAWGNENMYFFNAQNSLYLLPILSSLVVDNFARYQVTTNITSGVVGSLTIDTAPTNALKEATNIALELSNLIPLKLAPPKWKELMNGRKIITNGNERVLMQAKLDALIFIHYSRASTILTPEDFKWIIENRFLALERKTEGKYKEAVYSALLELWPKREELQSYL